MNKRYSICHFQNSDLGLLYSKTLPIGEICVFKWSLSNDWVSKLYQFYATQLEKGTMAPMI